jgi:hypothetical protein
MSFQKGSRTYFKGYTFAVTLCNAAGIRWVAEKRGCRACCSFTTLGTGNSRIFQRHVEFFWTRCHALVCHAVSRRE